MAARKEPAPPPARPLIGINTELLAPKNAPAYLRLNAGYVDAILAGGGLPVVLPARAALESASLVSVEQGLVTVDSALRLGLCDADEVERRRAATEHWPDSLGLRLVVSLADARHGSAGEGRTAHLLFRANLPRPIPQYEVWERGELLGTVDFAWPEHGVILEFDGKVKYEKYLRPGESASDAVVREKRREDRIREATGWVVIRVTWADLADPTELVARLRRVLRRRAA